VTSSSGAAPVPSLAAPGQTALVVESGPDVNKLIDDVLTSEGWSFRRVSNNQAALSLAAANPFDLIITGAKTHGPEDLELLRRIRSVRPHQRLIILTEEWTPGDVIAAMREGAFSYLVAPFEQYTLLEMVRAAMDSPCWDDGIEILSATPAWVSLTARCDSVTADRLVQFLRGARQPDLPETDREDVIAAFREILLNAMEHGGKFDPRQYVEISFLRTRRVVVCRVPDSVSWWQKSSSMNSSTTRRATMCCSSNISIRTPRESHNSSDPVARQAPSVFPQGPSSCGASKFPLNTTFWSRV